MLDRDLHKYCPKSGILGLTSSVSIYTYLCLLGDRVKARLPSGRESRCRR